MKRGISFNRLDDGVPFANYLNVRLRPETLGDDEATSRIYNSTKDKTYTAFPSSDQGDFELTPQRHPLWGDYDCDSILGESTRIYSVCSGTTLCASLVPAFLDSDRLSFIDSFITIIRDEPFVDGFEHPAEHLISNAYAKFGFPTLEWIDSVWLYSQKRPSMMAGVLKCVAASKYRNISFHLHALIPLAIEYRDPEILEAVVYAVELVEDKDLAIFLQDSAEWEPSWLQEYKTGVCKDILGG